MGININDLNGNLQPIGASLLSGNDSIMDNLRELSAEEQKISGGGSKGGSTVVTGGGGGFGTPTVVTGGGKKDGSTVVVGGGGTGGGFPVGVPTQTVGVPTQTVGVPTQTFGVPVQGIGGGSTTFNVSSNSTFSRTNP